MPFVCIQYSLQIKISYKALNKIYIVYKREITIYRVGNFFFYYKQCMVYYKEKAICEFVKEISKTVGKIDKFRF